MTALTWRRTPSLATDHRPHLLIPTGSLEQHGPHLPLGTDALIAEAVADQVCARVREIPLLLAPPVTYASSGEHEHFPGTISIGRAALTTMLVEVGRSACRWAAGIVFVNAHGGNAASLVEAVQQLRYEGRNVSWAPILPPDSDAHAGFTETSLMLHLHPDAVAMERVEVGNADPLDQLLPQIRTNGVHAVSRNGVLGDPREANAEAGRNLFEAVVADVIERVRSRRVGRTGILGGTDR